MIDIFLRKDLVNLFKNKNVVFMGDSNIRALYKDVLCLHGNSVLISQKTLKNKMEDSCFGDQLLACGPKYNGREYKEEREAIIRDRKISFFFITRVYNEYVKQILEHLSCINNLPDVLIINSCLWDVTRWGPRGVESYKENLDCLMKELKKLFPDCLVIWVTAPPIACELKGGFLVQELQFLKYSLRFHVMEANQFAKNIAVRYGFDVVDSHYHLKMQLHRRCDDGIHWQPAAVRYITNLLLTHISLAWNVPLPHRLKSDVMQEKLMSIISDDKEITSDSQPKKQITEISSTIHVPVFHNEKLTNECKIKVEKENFDSPVKPKQKKKKKSPAKKKAFHQQSHHAYLSRVQKNERHRRIKQWQPPQSHQRNVSAFGSPYNSTNNYHYNNNQHDSGYFSNSVNYSPQHSPFGSPNYQFSSNQHNYSDTVDYSVQHSPYYSASSPRSYQSQSEPYPFHRYSQPSLLPTPTQSQSNRRVILADDPNNQAYSVQRFSNQNFHPVIDFASTDNISFGIQF